MIQIYCDGSCLKNGLPNAVGGWNFLIIENCSNGTQTIVNSQSGREPPTSKLPPTNIRMELMAVIKALEYYTEPSDFLIHTDSAYIVNGVNQEWYKVWFRTGKNSLGKVPANLDLWERLVKQLEFHKEVKLIHVRGHSGHRFQEISDLLAKQAARMS